MTSIQRSKNTSWCQELFQWAYLLEIAKLFFCNCQRSVKPEQGVILRRHPQGHPYHLPPNLDPQGTAKSFLVQVGGRILPDVLCQVRSKRRFLPPDARWRSLGVRRPTRIPNVCLDGTREAPIALLLRWMPGLSALGLRITAWMDHGMGWNVHMWMGCRVSLAGGVLNVRRRA